MSLEVRVSGVMKTADYMGVMVGGVMKEIESAWVMTSSGLKLFYLKAGTPSPPPDPTPAPDPTPDPIVLTVTASPGTSISGTTPHSGVVVATAGVSISASGGTGPYQYSWSLLSYTAEIPIILDPDAAATAFQAEFYEPYGSTEAVFRCNVTDSLGNIGSIDITANFYRNW
jgi:hypothetical protein